MQQPQPGTTPGPEVPDGVLVGQALAGDELAFATLVDRYQDLLRGYIHGMLNDGEQSSDVLQQEYSRKQRDEWGVKGAWLSSSAQHVSSARSLGLNPFRLTNTPTGPARGAAEECGRASHADQSDRSDLEEKTNCNEGIVRSTSKEFSLII
jgi:hypothetical protein